MTPADYWRAVFEAAGSVLCDTDQVLDAVADLRHTAPDDELERVAASVLHIRTETTELLGLVARITKGQKDNA